MWHLYIPGYGQVHHGSNTCGLRWTLPWSHVFVAIDAHSMWPEVIMMTSTKTTKALRSILAHHGFPVQLVSDNRPQFTSREFSQFLKGNSIKHILSTPYHPASNGLAERFVQTLKHAMKAGEREGKSLHHLSLIHI